MTSRGIEHRLTVLGQGACVSYWNGSFDVQLLDAPEKGQRRVLASGNRIDAELFDRADTRLADIRSRSDGDMKSPADPLPEARASRPVAIAIAHCGFRGKRPIYAAKLGTGASTSIVVKRARKFFAGQTIEYAETWDLRSQSIGVTPKWKTGLISSIQNDRLFISKL